MLRYLTLLIAFVFVAASGSSGKEAPPPKFPPAAAPMPAGASWLGDWDTNQGPMNVWKSKGDLYATVGAVTLSGKTDGNRWNVQWINSSDINKSGWATFEMAPDGNSFHGTYGMGWAWAGAGDWNGTRTPAAAPAAH